MFTTSLFIGVLFVRIILAGEYSDLPGEIAEQVTAQYLQRNRHSDSRCDIDEKYCESNRVICMQHNENLREALCAKNNSCPSGQICYLSNPCPANRSTGCTTYACYGLPCHNGGSCYMDSTTKGYSCDCQSGYDPATDCLTRQRQSRSLTTANCFLFYPCRNGGTCHTWGRLYYCTCAPGFYGDYCQNNINECQSSPCVQGNCTDYVNNYTCECHLGFTGVNCDTDINECQSSPCVQGNCTDYVNNYTCDCQPGFTGVNCDTDINDCQRYPCVHGNCTDHVNMYTCECQPGFTGVNCDTDINDCESYPCAHGNCTDHVNMYTCECQPGFTGVNCETEINECNSSPCVHGTCDDKTAKYSCICDSLYSGINCDEVNVGVVVPLVAVPVAALALGGLGFALCRKKIGKKNSTTPSPENQDLGRSEKYERNPENIQSS